MSSGYSSKIWCCPFFKWDERLRVHCEGGCAAFPDMTARADFINRFCAATTGWERCSVAEAMMRYYERMEQDAKHRQNQEPGA